MKKLFFIFLVIISAGADSLFSNNTLIVEGNYQDKNLYVQNGFAYEGVGFCTYEVRINGQVTTDEVNSRAFEIDFTALQIKPGTHVVVEILHKDGCTPKVLNPWALQPKATFNIVAINIDKKGLLNWSTKNEDGSLPYIVEQFRWNKWIPVGEVNGSGDAGLNAYSFQTTPHSGENKFRVKQIGFNNITKLSENVIYSSTMDEPSYVFSKSKSNIQFSDSTLFEVYDAYGNIVKKGYGSELSIASLHKGNYYLCYDNETTDFSKR